MADTPLQFPRVAARARPEIAVFQDSVSQMAIEGIGDAEKVVFVSIGAGETRVNVVDGEGCSISAWVAIHGWAGLCGIEIPVEGRDAGVHPSSKSMISRALRGTLRVFGVLVDTSDFQDRAAVAFRNALARILDETVRDAREYDRIIFAAPDWLHPALAASLDLRPHIEPEVQDL